MHQDAYLLRFWRPSLRDGWRVTLIPVGEDYTEQHFSDLNDLFCHLQETYATPTEAEVDPRRQKLILEDRS